MYASTSTTRRRLLNMPDVDYPWTPKTHTAEGCWRDRHNSPYRKLVSVMFAQSGTGQFHSVSGRDEIARLPQVRRAWVCPMAVCPSGRSRERVRQSCEKSLKVSRVDDESPANLVAAQLTVPDPSADSPRISMRRRAASRVVNQGGGMRSVMALRARASESRSGSVDRRASAGESRRRLHGRRCRSPATACVGRHRDVGSPGTPCRPERPPRTGSVAPEQVDGKRSVELLDRRIADGYLAIHHGIDHKDCLVGDTLKRLADHSPQTGSSTATSSSTLLSISTSLTARHGSGP